MFEPTSKDFWRAIILYGSNMSTYKMGLGHLLINYADKNLEKIPLRDLSEDFMGLYSDKVKNGMIYADAIYIYDNTMYESVLEN